MRTRVAIVGAGPAGLLLGHLLRQAGIEAVVVERQGRDHILSRIRAGVLESTTTDLMRRLGLAGRLDREGLPHDGLTIVDHGRVIRIDVERLTGRTVTVYGQTEITRDLLDAAPARDLPILWDSPVGAIEGLEGDRARLHHAGGTVEADFVCACDGFHGIGRRTIPDAVRRDFDRAYPFGWLGVLADVPPAHHEIVYARHDRGFALASMRSPTRSRYYVQVPLDTDVADWPDARFWDELELRLGPEIAANVTRGPSIEKSVAPLRSFVSDPLQWGRLFLAGDAGHIVPPTGAKGLNLASSDVAYLSDALIRFYRGGDEAALAGYSDRALARVWKAERFAWYLTKLLHRFPEDGSFEHRMQAAELDWLAGSEAMQRAIAENYVGLPL